MNSSTPHEAADKGTNYLHIPFLLCADVLGILRRNDKDIKNITKDGEEYKFSLNMLVTPQLYSMAHHTHTMALSMY